MKSGIKIMFVLFVLGSVCGSCKTRQDFYQQTMQDRITMRESSESCEATV